MKYSLLGGVRGEINGWDGQYLLSDSEAIFSFKNVLRDRFSLFRHGGECGRRWEVFAEDFSVHVLLLRRRRRHREPVGRELHLQVAHAVLGDQLEAVNPE